MKDELNSIKLQNYKNSTEVVPGIAMEDIVKSCLLGRLNLLLIGDTGEGKTQLENDILGLFGNKGFFEQGRNDLTVREMFTKLNLDKIDKNKSTEGIKEITANAKHLVYVIDELTRCIPAVQNQFFNLFDGFITIDGQKYQLGKDGYSIGIASGNVGNGRFVGTSEVDRALLDRMHLIIDADAFPKSSSDTLDVLISKKDPRVSSAESTDKTEQILQAHKEFTEKSNPTLLQYVAAMYLVHGLDYLDSVQGNSKRKNKNAWPGCVKNHAKGSDAALIYPFSTRSAISTLTLAKAFEEVRKAKDNAYQDSLEAVFDAAYLIGAQSGVLAPAAVNQHYDGNTYSAMQAVMDGIRNEFSTKKDVLMQAIKSAQKGTAKHLTEFEGRWAYMKDILNRTANSAKK